MSEPTGAESAYERGARHQREGRAATSGTGGNFLTKKLGPLPVWAWAGLGLAMAIGYYLVKKKSASSATSTAAASQTGTTNSSLIPQFVNQVYTSGSPPAAHNMRSGSGSSSATETIPNTSVTVAVPNGTGGWEAAIFPSQTALQNFYNSIGITNGNYPNGLSASQISTGVTKAGGALASANYNQGPGGAVI